MENWTQRILLKSSVITVLLASLSVSVLAQDKPLIDPDVKPQKVDESLIDNENFEIGIFTGVMHIEDFESSVLYGARVAYHLSDTLFFEANYGITEGGTTSAEKLGLFNFISITPFVMEFK